MQSTRIKWIGASLQKVLGCNSTILTQHVTTRTNTGWEHTTQPNHTDMELAESLKLTNTELHPPQRDPRDLCFPQ